MLWDWNSHQLVIGHHWLAILNQVRKETCKYQTLTMKKKFKRKTLRIFRDQNINLDTFEGGGSSLCLSSSGTEPVTS